MRVLILLLLYAAFWPNTVAAADLASHLDSARRIYTYGGDPRTAASEAALVARAAPGTAEAHNILGWALRQLGDRQGSLREFSEAIRLAPGYADAYYGRAKLLYLEMGRPADAEPDYRKALRLAPQRKKYWVGWGHFLLETGPYRGGFEPAHRAYTYALTLSTDADLDASIYTHRAVSDLLLDRRQQADADFAAACRLQPAKAAEFRREEQIVLGQVASIKEMMKRPALVFQGTGRFSSAGSSFSAASGQDDSAARAREAERARRNGALQSAWEAGDHGAYERIQGGQSTWSDKSNYGD